MILSDNLNFWKKIAYDLRNIWVLKTLYHMSISRFERFSPKLNPLWGNKLITYVTIFFILLIVDVFGKWCKTVQRFDRHNYDTKNSSFLIIQLIIEFCHLCRILLIFSSSRNVLWSELINVIYARLSEAEN